MDIVITPKKLIGSVAVIPSKSQAHRVLICSAFADKATEIICPVTNRDIQATVSCLNALGATITETANGYRVLPIQRIPKTAILDCAESGSTLRFMLPIVGALGVDARFKLSGRLSERPLSPLWELMEHKGCSLVWEDKNILRCVGKLKAGNYSIDGSISSQFITGLYFALPLLCGTSTLEITGKIESAPYIELTKEALSKFGVTFDNNEILGRAHFCSPGQIAIEGDWSNGAFFHVANYIENDLKIGNLDHRSKQGDRIVVDILKQLQSNTTVDATHIPDLIPILSVAAARSKGATFTNIRRLRLKESDRVQAIVKMLSAFGVHATADENTLTVFPGKFSSCTVDTFNDHRIAMSAAIAATVADGQVQINGAECVAKSYPNFWDEYSRLGGTYEQYLR